MIIDQLNQIRNETVGGKAQELLTLRAHSHPVPNLFVLPASAFSAYLAHNTRNDILSETQKAVVRRRLTGWNWP